VELLALHRKVRRPVRRVPRADVREHVDRAAGRQGTGRLSERRSAGSQPRYLARWRAQIDMLCPDVYLPNFSELADRYNRKGAPLFIPESSATVGARPTCSTQLGRTRA